MTTTSKPNRTRVTLLLAAMTILSACHASKPGAAKRYPFTGRVISIDAQSQSAVIDGDNIPGFMDAMAMSYKIKPASTLTRLAPGDSISAEVVVEPAKSDDAVPDNWLENVKVTAHGKNPSPAPTAQHIPAAGETVPNFSFTNQDGRKISLHQYRGKVLLVTFLYTRCPFPDYCPRVSTNFAEIDKQLIDTQLATDASLANVNLLRRSFVPEHDKPATLRAYGFSVAHTHDSALFRRWQFAAPSAADLPAIANFFGLVYKPDAGLITHNLSTTVIGPDGKVISWYHGSDWQVSDLIKDSRGAQPSKPQSTS
jgi:protein SCO1/2